MQRASALVVTLFVTACGGGGGGGTGGGGGSGGAFLLDRDTEAGTPQVARDGAGVLHLLASAPAADAQGHAFVRYGRCPSGCGAPSGWTTGLIADGAFSDGVKLAVEPGGTVHVALFSPQLISFGTCATGCTSAASWSWADVTPPMGQTWKNLPRGRAFAVSATGQPRLLVNGGGNVLLLLANDGAGFLADPLLDFEANAVSMLTAGDAVQLVVAPLNSPYQLTFAECASGCAAVTAWTKAAVLPGNSYALGLDRGAGGELHLAYTSSSGSADELRYARCDGSCTTPASWASVAVGDGNDARGGLDVSVRAGGAVAIAGATVAGMDQSVNLRRCAQGCTSASSWSGGLLEAGADVQDAHPTTNGAACDEASTLRYWTVGELVQLVPTQTGWLLAYDAASNARCLAGTGSNWVSGRWVRLQERE